MLTASIRNASLAIAAGGLALAVPASAVQAIPTASYSQTMPVYGDLTANHGKDHGRHRGWDKRDRRNYDRYSRSGYQPQGYYNDGNRNQPYWRGDDGRYYCRKSDGTTGLIIGGAAGALLGREIAGRGDRTLGTILGAAGGALLGKTIDSKVRCN